MIDTDIIKEVDGEPNQWISPIVTPPKTNGADIRLYVDMREANSAVKRERHTLSTIEGLEQCETFSKLDLRSGYHKLELHPESRYVTMMYIQHASRNISVQAS